VSRSRQILFSVILIAVLTVISFSSSIMNDFVNYDDVRFVVRNDLIKELSVRNVKQMFTQMTFEYENLYIPFVWLSFAADYQLWGLWAPGYHAENLLLHIANALLVFYLILKLTASVPVAAVAGILFGIHPLHVESVAWVTERKDVLSTLFFLLSLLLYVSYVKSGKYISLILSAAVFLLALMSKPMAVTLAFVIILIDHLLGRPLARRTVLEKVPFFLGALAVGLATVLLQRAPEGGGSFFEGALLGSRNFFFYIYKTILPVRLSVFYPLPQDIALSNPVYAASLLGFAAAVILILLSARISKRVFFALMFFLITLLPVLQFIRIGKQNVADRFMYLPSIGPFLIAGIAYEKLRANADNKIARRAGLVILTLVCVILSFLSFQRCRVWATSETLWRDALSRGESFTAHHNLGMYYLEEKRYDEALTQLEKALSRGVEAERVLTNLGTVYREKGMLQKAQEAYLLAIDANPSYTTSYTNLAEMLIEEGRLEDAERYLLAAKEKSTVDFFMVRFNLGVCYYRMGRYKEAEAEFMRSATLNPYYAKTQLYLGILKKMDRDFPAAEKHLRKALELDPHSARAHVQLGDIFTYKMLLDEAANEYNTAIELEPEGAEGLTGLAYVCFLQGKFNESLEIFKKAAALSPEDSRAHLGLAEVYAATGFYDRAIREYRLSLESETNTERIKYIKGKINDLEKKRK